MTDTDTSRFKVRTTTIEEREYPTFLENLTDVRDADKARAAEEAAERAKIAAIWAKDPVFVVVRAALNAATSIQLARIDEYAATRKAAHGDKRRANKEAKEAVDAAALVISLDDLYSEIRAHHAGLPALVTGGVIIVPDLQNADDETLRNFLAQAELIASEEDAYEIMHAADGDRQSWYTEPWRQAFGAVHTTANAYGVAPYE